MRNAAGASSFPSMFRLSSSKITFTTSSNLTNDEKKTRTFLTLDVSPGHHILIELAQVASFPVRLTPYIAASRQKEYYTDPRFHASAQSRNLAALLH